MQSLYIVLVLCIKLAITLQECTKGDIEGNIRLCLSEEGAHLERGLTQVRDGTKCFIERESVFQDVLCTGGQWQSNYDSLKINESTKRVKRGWLSKVGHFLGHLVTCVATLLLACGRGGPPPDKTPPDMQPCPIIKHAIAEPFQTYAKVTWTEPTAYDKKDGNVRVYRNGGRAPGRHFTENSPSFEYIAKDRHGNKNTCKVTIIVKVVRCKPPKAMENGYYICHPSTEFVRGGWCKFGCYDGFDLDGDEQITCQDNGTWSAAQSTCRAWTCPQPSIVTGAAGPNCTQDNKYRSVCSYNCHVGFDMPPKVSKTMVCDMDKRWRKHGDPKCIDVEAPVFDMCPVSTVFGTDTGVDTATIHWEDPLVSDNSNVSIKPTTNIAPGSKKAAGIYDILYGAEDGEGNLARQCTFQAIVRDTRCSKLYPTPYVQMNCPNGYRTGSGCNVHCDPGKTMNGSDYVTCKKSQEGMYGEWNWKGGYQTKCSSTNKCTSIQPPTNGAVVCDNWIGGKFCLIQCRNGTEMKLNWKRLFVCSTGGIWIPNLPVLHECKIPKHPRPIQRLYVSFYYYGDCTDDGTKDQIGQHLVNVLKTSPFAPEGCADVNKCSKENVQISCGATTRAKREVVNITDDEPMLLVINFYVPLQDNWPNINETLIKISLNAIEHLLQTSSALIFGSNSTKFNSFKSLGLDVRCGEGHVKIANSLSCVECPPGTFYSKGTRDCISCSKGEFQDMNGQLHCKTCPFGKTTRTVGASSSDDCEAACEPGSFSINGIVPCSPCEQGQYQPSYGQTKCHDCFGSKTTMTSGSKDRSECKEFDIVFPVGGKKQTKLTLQDEKVLTDFTLSVWVRGTTDEIGNKETIDVDFLDTNMTTVFAVKQLRDLRINNISEVAYDSNFDDNRWHSLIIEIKHCIIYGYLDGIPFQIHQQTECKPVEIKGISITAGDYFSGSLSQLNIWSGNEAKISPFRCFPHGGKASISWQEFGVSEMHNAYLNMPSQCDDFDNCKSSPCIHGNCTDDLHGFQCDCHSGYTGKQCDNNIDDCLANVCMNNASCVDGVGEYSCLCPASFTGEFCEIKMVDGQWSKWTRWTECTTTCGPGKQFRKRLCNNPHPDNGGKPCVGDATETVECHNELCPVCPVLEAPGNGSISCNNDSGRVSCSISCDEGFDFDIAPLDSYLCGPETAFEWNFQNDQNPLRTMPKCTEIKMPDKVTGHFFVRYEDLVCSSKTLKEKASVTIVSAVQRVVNSLPCMKKSLCTLEALEVTNCKYSKRFRRSLQTAGISLNISTTKTDEGSFPIQELQDAFRHLHSSANNGSLTVDVLDDTYELEGGGPEVTAKVECSPGMTWVNFYCVPCGLGSHAKEDYCTPCTIGTYQDEQSQRSCKFCPSGTTTLGIGSTNAQDCTVAVNDLNNGMTVTGIVVGCSCVLVVALVVAFAIRRYRHRYTRKIVVPVGMSGSGLSTVSDISMGTFGPSKPVFTFHR